MILWYKARVILWYNVVMCFRRFQFFLLCLMCCATAALTGFGYNDPPYYLYPYVPDATDRPPLYYTKVCPVGKTAEADADSVTIGVWYPREYQGVTPNYSGDLVIPETIDGLPVRAIMPKAFSLCQSLTSVRIPSTVREVGERAFAWCTSLTNVTFAEGTAVVGSCAFTNCVALKSVTFPRSLSFIGPGCFARCEALESVTFLGDAPRLDLSYAGEEPYLGEKLYSYNGFSPRFTVFIPKTAYGWVRPYARGVPEKWPLDFGWMKAYPVEGYDSEKPRGFMMTISKAK